MYKLHVQATCTWYHYHYPRPPGQALSPSFSMLHAEKQASKDAGRAREGGPGDEATHVYHSN